MQSSSCSFFITVASDCPEDNARVQLLIDEWLLELGEDLRWQLQHQQQQQPPVTIPPPEDGVYLPQNGGLALLLWVRTVGPEPAPAQLAGLVATKRRLLSGPAEHPPPAPEVDAWATQRALPGCLCEMKRLYIRPSFRGRGLARPLLDHLMRLAANRLGYRWMCLDTLDRLKAARILYDQLGFRECTPYYHNPLPNVVYLLRALSPDPEPQNDSTAAAVGQQQAGPAGATAGVR